MEYLYCSPVLLKVFVTVCVIDRVCFSQNVFFIKFHSIFSISIDAKFNFLLLILMDKIKARNLKLFLVNQENNTFLINLRLNLPIQLDLKV